MRSPRTPRGNSVLMELCFNSELCFNEIKAIKNSTAIIHKQVKIDGLWFEGVLDKALSSSTEFPKLRK